MDKDTPHEMPYVPDYASHYIDWFLRLSLCRRSGFSGAEPISDLDIWAWQQNCRLTLDPFDVDTLISMDCSYRSAMREDLDAQKERDKNKRKTK